MRSRVNVIPLKLLFLFVSGALLWSGCKGRVLPSTNVPPTADNKAVVKFLEQYKAAVEKRSVEAILEMVAKDYSDNMGSEDPSLQVDYLSLKERLEKTLPRIEDLRLGMFVQHIAKIEKDVFEVVFYFNQHILMDVPSGDKWTSIKEVSRMVLRRKHDKNSPYQFEILQGI
jgi:hypothetical protein